MPSGSSAAASRQPRMDSGCRAVREGTEIPIIPNISSFSELLVKSFQQMARRMFDAHTFHQSLNDRETPPPPGWQAKQTEI
ncbi:hypothetical protein [Herbaspirillum sp.]|uniref:hypothetical protein n=1 Tax=Herbaspirillum sp. TaxID=1890675 RepID=UPI001B2D7759|nr:hypothetical protein [Herbaspirillum sp.]MBO9537535.1 hypothetical protein [Herbaspirillum sp.]